MKYRQCARCVMDNQSDETISFDEKGYCNYCNEAIARMGREYFPNEEGKKQLDSIFLKIKRECARDQYDCLVGVSGGLDSTYILYLGYQYGLRMLAIHVDDGLDTEIAKQNIRAICERTGTKLICVQPKEEQYRDTILSFLKAGVPNLALVQDNLLDAELNVIAKKYKIKYSLSGGNFSSESILQRGCTHNAFDKTHIRGIEKRFSTVKWKDLRLTSLGKHYIINHYFGGIKKVYPLNYIDYNIDRAIKELGEFSGYCYYGGKHYESVLTRFMQCFYLPEKFKHDKRKSHYSSLIVCGQMSREEAIEKLSMPKYVSEEMKNKDIDFLAEYLGISSLELIELIQKPAKQHSEYPISHLMKLGPIARKARRFLAK